MATQLLNYETLVVNGVIKIIIKTYRELGEYMQMFRKQNSDLLIIMSNAGYGKTTVLSEVMKGSDYVYINTHSTPLKTYLTLWEKRDCPVVFDDIDSILGNPIFVSMLKALANTSAIKELHYNSTSKLLGNAPESFKTTSNVCILLNEFDVRNKALQPLLDRGFFIEFVPSKEEILSKIELMSKSQSISIREKCVFEFIQENYQKIANLSLRVYMKGLQLYRDNPENWKEKFMQLIGFDEKLVEYLKLKEKFKTDNERIKNFKWSRATYYRVKQEAEEDGNIVGMEA